MSLSLVSLGAPGVSKGDFLRCNLVVSNSSLLLKHHLSPKFDHPIAWDLVKARCTCGVAEQEDEKFLAPQSHP